MIKIINPHICCGCSVCVLRCPKQCISLREDREGFLYPFVDENRCIHCGLCVKICPSNHVLQHKACHQSFIKAFAAKNPNLRERMHSSSGGVFLALAKIIIEKGGIVFGATYDSEWGVCISYAEKIESVYRMMGSKYVQAYIKDSYCTAESFLKQGKKVLFSGTPCQIIGLRSFLKRDYQNLLTVDLLCHGVPSPNIWQRYLSETISRNGQHRKDITDIIFRSKKNPYTWQQYGLEIHMASIDRCLVSEKFQQNIYMRGFLDDLYLRPSCYRCIYKKYSLHGDITLGDFWGIHQILPKLEDSLGVGLVLVSSVKGIESLNELKIEKYEVSLEKVMKMNSGFDAYILPHPNRKRFFRDIQNDNCSVQTAIQRNLQLSFFSRLSIKVRRKLLHIFN